MSERTLDEEILALDGVLDQFVDDCRKRLHEKAHAGYRGWDDPGCEEDIAGDLSNDANEAWLTEDRAHLPDIANRAMMLWWLKRQKEEQELVGQVESEAT